MLIAFSPRTGIAEEHRNFNREDRKRKKGKIDEQKTAINDVVLAFTMLLSANLNAEEYLYVHKIEVGEDNYLAINVRQLDGTENFSFRHGCQERWWARSQFPITDERTKAMLQVATTSFVGRKRVYVYTRGCTGTFSNGYPVMTKLQVRQ